MSNTTIKVSAEENHGDETHEGKPSTYRYGDYVLVSWRGVTIGMSICAWRDLVASMGEPEERR